MDKRTVYADNAATTRVSPEVYEVMKPYFDAEYGNPSSIYGIGGRAKKAVTRAREQVAAAIGAQPGEIYFTSCGTESDNWAIKGAAEANAGKGRHIVTSKIEHHAVLRSCEHLEKLGWEITYLDVDSTGLVSPEALEKAIRPDTVLVSIMAANNEIGTIEPVAELGAVCRRHGVPFHTDAVQALGHTPIDVEKMNIDMLSASGHKLNAPKGMGFLYVRKGTKLANLIDGGGQEKNRRGGTENVPYIAGLGQAVADAITAMDAENARLNALRARLDEIVLSMPKTIVTGHPTKRLAGTCSYCINAVEGESLVLMLDLNGVMASSGSACSSGSLDPSHVLTAIGLPHEVAHGSLRISLGRYNTAEDVEYIGEKLRFIVGKLRAMSPVWDENEGGNR